MISFFHSPRLRFPLLAICAILTVYLLLLIPDSGSRFPSTPESVDIRPFLWNQDERWDSLETIYANLKLSERAIIRRALDTSLQKLVQLSARIETGTLSSSAPAFQRLEDHFFALAPFIAICPERVEEYIAHASRTREAVKKQSRRWDMNDRATRERLYRILYGERSAVEEVILQLQAGDQPPALVSGTDEPSSTPKTSLLGITIHSGDILVSRGGAPTSALIARGNDFQGNFSHIAIVHVDSVSGDVSIVESHIERGVAVATAEDYLRDTKLRVMVLRLRSDLPAIRRDPLLPHKAASAILGRARFQHIPYDFSMDYGDTSKFFCSEVASAAYDKFGVNLWMGMSHISSPGLRALLADFGVRHFETQEPSDLEYDPQIAVVAEWRDVETLRKDHLDNAATDAILEESDRGFRLRYDWYLLPIARVLKGYCCILNIFGVEGIIPEGMSATSALKHEFYKTLHTMIVEDVNKASGRFLTERGFNPPYWKMLAMARAAMKKRFK